MLFGSMLLAASALAAPQEPATVAEQSTIVVTGKKKSDDEIRDFVRALTPVDADGRLNRFEQPVCPVALGLPGQQGAALARRMRQVAKEVRIDVGDTDCLPNVVVMVTQGKKILIQTLQRRYPHYFGELSNRQIRQLADRPGPAAAWHTEGPPINARGVELAHDANSGVYINRTTDPASRINDGGRRQFAGAVVVVERGALAGLTVTQLADYAAMRAFTEADPSRIGMSGALTILHVLDAPMGSEVPVTLTRWDLAFLRGYYSSPRNLRASAQRSAISRAMAKEVDRRPTGLRTP